MKNLFFTALLFCIVGVSSILPAVEQPAPTIELDSSGDLSFEWEGVQGRTYFMQYSMDLKRWSYVPEIRHAYGPGATFSYGFSADTDQFYLRLAYSDNQSEHPEYGDFDGDGRSNQAELLLGTDPLVPEDTGTSDPTNQGPPDPPGDGTFEAPDLIQPYYKITLIYPTGTQVEWTLDGHFTQHATSENDLPITYSPSDEPKIITVRFEILVDPVNHRTPLDLFHTVFSFDENGGSEKTTSISSVVIEANTASQSFTIPVAGEAYNGTRYPNTLFPLVALGVDDTKGFWVGKLDGTGVDNQSRRGEIGSQGAQSAVWIMAPHNEEPNRLLMGTGAYPFGGQIMQIADDTGSPNGSILSNNYQYVRWSGTVDWPEEGGLKLKSTNQTNAPLEVPIWIKNMARHTVSVFVEPIVSLLPDGDGDGQPDKIHPVMPTEAELQTYLDRVYLDQINLKCQVVMLPEREAAWDIADATSHPDPFQAPAFASSPGDQYFDLRSLFSPEQIAVQGLPEHLPNLPRKITIFVLGGASNLREIKSLNGLSTLGVNLLGKAEITQRICYIVGNPDYAGSPDLDEVKERTKHLIAHEMGHIIIGGGHPDNGNINDGGPANFGDNRHAEHYSRLMLSGYGMGNRESIKLVKAEWDAAENNLPSLISKP